MKPSLITNGFWSETRKPLRPLKSSRAKSFIIAAIVMRFTGKLWRFGQSDQRLFIYETFQVEASGTEGQFIYDLGNRQWDIPRLRELLEKILPNNSMFDNFEVEHDFPKLGPRRMKLDARRLPFKGEKQHLILLSFEDVTETK